MLMPATASGLLCAVKVLWGMSRVGERLLAALIAALSVKRRQSMISFVISVRLTSPTADLMVTTPARHQQHRSERLQHAR
jgi:hypothetical protein